MSKSDVTSIAQQMVSSCDFGLPNQFGTNRSPYLPFLDEADCGPGYFGGVAISKRGRATPKCFCLKAQCWAGGIGRAAAPTNAKGNYIAIATTS